MKTRSITRLGHIGALLSLTLAHGALAAESAASPVPDDWREVVTSAQFSFHVPANMRQVSGQGIDSYVEVFRSDSMELFFDYGRFGNPGHDHDELIDGHLARITVQSLSDELRPYTRLVLLQFADIGRQPDNLVMGAYVKNDDGIADAKIIFRSVRFNSDAPPRYRTST
jgi:hypothetical protein